MDDSALPQVHEHLEQLEHEVPDFKLRESLALPEHVLQSLVRAVLEQDVDAELVFEEAVEVANVGVLDLAVHSDLPHQHYFGDVAAQSGFRHHLHSVADLPLLV